MKMEITVPANQNLVCHHQRGEELQSRYQYQLYRRFSISFISKGNLWNQICKYCLIPQNCNKYFFLPTKTKNNNCKDKKSTATSVLARNHGIIEMGWKQNITNTYCTRIDTQFMNTTFVSILQCKILIGNKNACIMFMFAPVPELDGNVAPLFWKLNKRNIFSDSACCW